MISKEKKREYDLAYSAANKSKILARKRAQYAANAHIRDKKRAYRLANAKRFRERDLAWRVANAGQKVEYDRAYRKANADKVRAYNLDSKIRRRTLEGNIERENISASQLALILQSPCIYCGDPSEHIDHVIPLARGGIHTIDNLVPACAPCNLSKGVKLPGIEWFGRIRNKNLDAVTDSD